jgi:hypothetical protein
MITSDASSSSLFEEFKKELPPPHPQSVPHGQSPNLHAVACNVRHKRGLVRTSAAQTAGDSTIPYLEVRQSLQSHGAALAGVSAVATWRKYAVCAQAL